MSIRFQSFGYKHGPLPEADLLYDLRALPNPYWVRQLRPRTGQDRGVIEFLEGQVLCARMFEDICNFLDFWLPRYLGGDRSEVTVGLGCTGGRHRSVYLADKLFNHYREQFPDVAIGHRELGD